MLDHEKILNFISRFHGSEYVFLHGCCYWFAYILQERFFGDYRCDILYEPEEGHFITRISSYAFPDSQRFFDVRGDVTELYQDKAMYDMSELACEDSALHEHLMRDCRDFEEVEDDA